MTDLPRDDSRDGRRPPLKSIALPAEHGSWSLVTEPILLGLLVAPSWAGLALAAAAFALFLLNRPLKVYAADRRRGRSYARTGYALRFVWLYGIIGLAAAAAALALAGLRPFLPLVVALPLVAVFMVYDQRPGRHWQAELLAPVAFAAVVASIALADGWALVPALALWVFMAARAVPAVIFVRERLRLDKGKPARPGVAVLAHAVAVAVVAALALAGWLPWLAVLAMVILLGRAAWALSPYRWRSSIKALGFLETGFGLLAVLLTATGYWLGW